MKSKAYITQKGNRTPTVPIIVGIGASLLATIFMSAVLTSLVGKGTLQSENIQFGVFMIRAIAVLVGAIITTGLHKENMLLDIGIVCASYLVILIAVAIVFYDGIFHNVGGGILSIFTGGVSTCLIRLKPPKRRRTNRRYTK